MKTNVIQAPIVVKAICLPASIDKCSPHANDFSLVFVNLADFEITIYVFCYIDYIAY